MRIYKATFCDNDRDTYSDGNESLINYYGSLELAESRAPFDLMQQYEDHADSPKPHWGWLRNPEKGTTSLTFKDRTSIEVVPFYVIGLDDIQSEQKVDSDSLYTAQYNYMNSFLGMESIFAVIGRYSSQNDALRAVAIHCDNEQVMFDLERWTVKEDGVLTYIPENAGVSYYSYTVVPPKTQPRKNYRLVLNRIETSCPITRIHLKSFSSVERAKQAAVVCVNQYFEHSYIPIHLPLKWEDMEWEGDEWLHADFDKSSYLSIEEEEVD